MGRIMYPGVQYWLKRLSIIVSYSPFVRFVACDATTRVSARTPHALFGSSATSRSGSTAPWTDSDTNLYIHSQLFSNRLLSDYDIGLSNIINRIFPTLTRTVLTSIIYSNVTLYKLFINICNYILMNNFLSSNSYFLSLTWLVKQSIFWRRFWFIMHTCIITF